MEKNLKEEKTRKYPRYVCPLCRDNPSLIVYDYAKRNPVCGNCGTPFSDFIEDYRSITAKNL